MCRIENTIVLMENTMLHLYYVFACSVLHCQLLDVKYYHPPLKTAGGNALVEVSGFKYLKARKALAQRALNGMTSV